MPLTALKHRNNAAFPILERPHTYSKEEIRQVYAQQDWRAGLSPGERLWQHHTLSSARCVVNQRTNPRVPRDRLDLALSSYLRNGSSSFVRVPELYTQCETIGLVTWRVLRNYMPAPYRISYEFNHPLRTTREYERNQAHKINLDASLEHSVLTGPNFRRRADGGFFRV